MATRICQTGGYRNSSVLNTIPNHSNIRDIEWITNSLSLIIFILAFIGNTAALIVMFGTRGPIRLTNNKYLANLACADLLRACFMPFTIIARMKKNFMFGRMICKILPIVQGLSVAVDVFTLVCISIERYLAICRPLLILKLQSVRFANLFNALILFLIWSLGLLIAIPNFYIYNLCSLPKVNRFKCEKSPPQEFKDEIYMVALVGFYFVIPMVVMIVLYTLIILKMSRNNTAMKMRSFQNSNLCKIRSNSSTPPLVSFNKHSRYRSAHSDSIDEKKKSSLNSENSSRQLSNQTNSSRSKSIFNDEDQKQKFQLDITHKSKYFNRTRAISHPITVPLPQYNHHHHSLKRIFQHSNIQNRNSQNSYTTSQRLSRMDRHRRKALKLLITLIVEFFVCWTPLFIYHTIGTFNKKFYRSTPNIFVDLILLFSFASASCNPLTYYFMSKRYRSVLYAYLPCYLLNNNQQIFINYKYQQKRQFMQALHSSQHQNSNEKKRKQQAIIDDHHHHHARLRSKTLHF